MTHAFWDGFEKRAGATSGLTGGQGFTGAGKGNLGTGEERPSFSGPEGAYGRADGQDTRTDKTLIDRDRGARTEDPFSTGPEFQDETNPHIRY